MDTTDQEVNSDADCSLQEAIFAANLDASLAINPSSLNGPRISTGCTPGSGADTIVLPANSVFQVSDVVQSQFSIAGLTANPDIVTTITIQGNGSRLELVGGSNLRAFVVNQSVGEVSILTTNPATPVDNNGNLTIQNLHIKGFRADGGDGTAGGGGGLGAGGAIYVRSGTLTVDNSTFEGNSVTGGNGGGSSTGAGGGGGLGGDAGSGGGGSRGNGGAAGTSGGGGGGTANNGVDGGSGVGGNGGFNCGGKGGSVQPPPDPMFPSPDGGNGFCTGGGGGGGAYVDDEGFVQAGSGGDGNYGGGGGAGAVAGGVTTLIGGDGGDGGFGGGGGAGQGANGADPARMQGDGGNGGFGGGGGGVGPGGGGGVAGSGGTFGGNASGGFGGGGAGLGGAIFNDSGNVTIRNSTFVGNTATGGAAGGAGAAAGAARGGALFARDGSTKFYNSTIDGNTATGSSGGGIYIFGSSSNPSPSASFIIRNSIVSNNGTNACFLDVDGGGGSVATAGSGNLIRNNAAGTLACPGVVSTADPTLGPLQLNIPGNTPTMAITDTSPAFNTANNSACLATDQRGLTRPQGGDCDIGAFEVIAVDLSLEPPIPDLVDLDPIDDTGWSDTDDNTFDTSPHIRIQADLSDFAAQGFNIIADPTVAANRTNGLAVEVFVNGNSVGFATPIAGTDNTLYEFTLSSTDLDNEFPVFPPGTSGSPDRGWLNFVTAAVRLFDGAIPTPNTRRTLLSDPLLLTFDPDDPSPPSAPDLLSTSDSGISSTDNNTNVNPPAFQGTAEENTRIYVFANGVIVGVGVVGTDATDGVFGNGLGAWEVTIEPLRDGVYSITARVEDLGGNIGPLSAALSNLVIDTIDGSGEPQRATLDLTDAADSGRSNKDNITKRISLTFTVTAEPNSAVRIKDGETVIDSFVMPAAGTLTRTFGGFTERDHLLSAEAFDLAGNRSAQSEELIVQVDLTSPLLPTLAIDPAATDTGVDGFPATIVDRVTSDTNSSFVGTAEADAIIRMWVPAAAASIATTFAGSNQVVRQAAFQIVLGDAFVPVNVNQPHQLSGEAFSGDGAGGLFNPANRQFFGFASFDIDQNPILPIHVNKVSGATDTFLALPLNPGDATITLQNAVGWFNGGVAHMRSLAFYEYQDSTGFTYPDFTYTRNVFQNVWGLGGIVGNVINLTVPWAGPAQPAGAAVRNTSDGATYNYTVLSNQAVPDQLTPYVGTISGVQQNGAPSPTQFRPGTAFIKPVILFNYHGLADNRVTWQNVRITGAVSQGLTVALPEDGNQAFPNGQWNLAGRFDLNDPIVGFPLDGLRSVTVNAEDRAGNVSPNAQLDVLVDTQGPQVTAVYITAAPAYDLFNPKPAAGPTPLISSLSINVQDLPARVTGFLYDALLEPVAENPGHYHLVGDHNGQIAIASVQYNPAALVNGQIATGTLVLTFVAPLPDDRFTLTLDEALVDPAGNPLDGESNAAQPLETPLFPSGDHVPGGAFVARFTVDTRAELGVWAAGSVYVDTNGNFAFDPENADDTNEDISYVLGYASDNIFAGNFVAAAGGVADGFDKLAAYGRVGAQFRWLIDTDNNGVPNLNVPDPANLNALPAAGNFDGNAANGDEVALKDGVTWYLDTNHNFQVDTTLVGNMIGLPIIGDFDGDGQDDLAAWSNDTFFLNLSTLGAIDGFTDTSFTFGFPGVRERPLAADLDGDEIDDLGLWVPDRSGATPAETSEWYWLVSAGRNITARIVPNIDGPGFVVPFTPVPFGSDVFAQFGDEFGVPVPGNFDPPVVPNGSSPNTNLKNALDVNNDGLVVPIDALMVINAINTAAATGRSNDPLAATPDPARYLDVNGDGYLSPIDALGVINYLNGSTADLGAAEGEGEGEDEGAASPVDLSTPPNPDLADIRPPSGPQAGSSSVGTATAPPTAAATTPLTVTAPTADPWQQAFRAGSKLNPLDNYFAQLANDDVLGVLE